MISDGSPTSLPMYPSQNCLWVVSPIDRNASTAVVLEILRIDLSGGTISVYDGLIANPSNLLLYCDECVLTSQLIIARSGELLVHFSSSNNPSGTGFFGVYWTINLEEYNDSSNGKVLEIPSGISMDQTVDNSSLAWDLLVSTVESSMLRYSTSVVSTFSDDVTARTFDGRPTDVARFSSLQSPTSFCGILKSSGEPFLDYPQQLRLSTTQLAGDYLRSSAQTKIILDIIPEEMNTRDISINIPFTPSTICKYRVHSEFSISLLIEVVSFNGTQDGHLLILGGLTGTDQMLLSTDTSDISQLRVVAPCGKSTILLSSKTDNSPYYSLLLTYSLNSNDDGSVCREYIASLQQKPQSTVPWQAIIISVSLVGGLMILAIAYFLLHDRSNRSIIHRVSRKVNLRSVKVSQFQQIATHPRYTPAVDNLKNQFLPMGACCVCSAEKKVLSLGCEHALCLECVQGNLEAALNDIGMFPVRCPMHFGGCDRLFDARIAKRVLKEGQYKRFLDFQDRAMYGEGLRCIFCDQYVNLPVDNSISIVSCPHCLQRFCIRCKQSYTVFHKCPLAHVDDSLEQWKKQSGAQRCPSCLKLIEKDGEETCNHMVHKVTDSIPCVRERTDFCYICGTEVLFFQKEMFHYFLGC